VNPTLAPDPILEAVGSFAGSFIDLDRGVVVSSDEFRSVVPDLTASVKRDLIPGERVVMTVGNGPMFPAGLAAILREGGSPILLHAETPPAEIVRVADRFGAELLVSDSLREGDLDELGFTGHGFAPAPWAVGVCARIAYRSGEELRERVPAGVPLHPTSGTTGAPKLAVRPAAAAVAEARHYIEAIGIDERDTMLCTIPMSHAYGFGMCAMVPLLAGSAVASMRRYNPVDALRALREHRVTIYPSAPFALDLLLSEGGDRLPPPPRCITSAGAPLPERTAAQVRSRWDVTVRPLYGTTETGGISVASPQHDAADVSSVGPPMEGVDVEIRAADPNEEGVGGLWVRSGSLMSGYLGLGGDTVDGIEPSAIVDGWFDTGDLAHVGADGAIRLRGRASEVINVFGMKVLPMEVEEVISLMAAVDQVKVYGVPNRWGSHSVKAAVVANGGLSEAAVRAHCREHLVAYKRPEQIVMLERLPRSPSGKIVLAELP
jgi:acyl-CoA synthetase (AMP-forming)/AMP-acid ligase II